MQTMIKTGGLGHAFKEKQVLKGINLEIAQGEIFGLLGPSGAGKTTLINILTGQLKQSQGVCTIGGVDNGKLTGEHYKQMGIMMDSMGLYDRMNCLDNLKFYRMLDGRNSRKIRNEVKGSEEETGSKAGDRTGEIEVVLEQVGLLDAKKTLAMNLSKGMKNRLAFARAILRKPKILFLDEPTSGLDPASVEEIHKMILAEKERGTTIFLTTHNMHEAEKLCDNIALLCDGKIVEYGGPQELCRRYNRDKKFVLHLKDGSDRTLDYTEEAAEQIKNYINRGELETIHSTEPSLEMIFMELTGKELDK